jgi:hypothetical protein
MCQPQKTWMYILARHKAVSWQPSREIFAVEPCCEYTNIFPLFSFIIYSLNYFPDIFSILLFKACYLEVTDIFLHFSH